MNSRTKGEVLLKIQDLYVEGYSDETWHPIIRGADLLLRRGEVLGLIGESGAGKSTLGLAGMGFTKPGCRISGGSILFDGIDLVGASDAQKRALWGNRITYVAQSAAASFNPAHNLINQTVESTLSHGLNSRSKAMVDAVDLFKEMHLPNADIIGERYPHQVSGGQLQRVMTAMAMSPRPDLIIFDEPTTALDVTTQVEVLLSMRKIVDRFQTAALYITHDLAVVAQMADKIKVLRHGVEVEESDTREMLSNPKEDYTKSLWSVRAIQKEAAHSEEIVLRVRNIDARYGRTPVLHDVNINLPRGCTTSIVGESGSGKSTTARVITGLLPPSSGTVEFNGQSLPTNIKDRSVEQLRKIQMIYQMADTAMNPRQTVGEILGRPLEFYHKLKGKQRDMRIVELLRLIELDESYFDRLPDELSGGQKQRICIARALAAEPEVIICDEVTSSLDQIVQDGILQLLLRLQKERGISYLFITHDLATVKAISDEIVVMNAGRVVDSGPRDEVLSPPFSEYTDLLLSSVPEMDPDWLNNLNEQRQVLS